MTLEIAVFLFLLVVGLILFATERFPPDVTALGLMLSLIVLGLLEPGQAFAGFGSETVLMILGLLILTEALISTGLVDIIGTFLVRVVGTHSNRVKAILLIGPGILSSFISNTAAAAFFLPIALGLSRRTGISPSRLLMPLAFTAILAGSVTLIGTSTNLVASGLLQQAGLAPLGMFELTPVGLPILIAGMIYMATIGSRLIPDRQAKSDSPRKMDDDLYFSEIKILAGSKLIGKTMGSSGLLDEMELGVLVFHRGDQLLKPLAETVLEVDDVLLVEGRRESVLRLVDYRGVEICGKIDTLEAYIKSGNGRIAEVVILPDSILNGRTLKGLLLRERFKLQVLAISRRGGVQVNRIGQHVFHAGDVMLIRLPDDHLDAAQRERLFRVLDIIEMPATDRRRAWLASAVFIGALALGIFELLPLAAAVLLGALAAFVMRLIEPQEAYRRIQWQTLILIGSMLAFGRAMETTGAADYLAQLILTLPGSSSPILMLSVFFFVAVALTQPLSNQAATAVLIPIGLQTAALLGLNPRAFAVMIVLGGTASFITPLEPACMLIFNAGHYRFKDFLRVGLLLTFVVYAIAIVMVPMLWKLEG